MRQLLSNAGFSLIEKDFFVEMFTVESLCSLLKGVSARDVFAVRSPMVKKLNLEIVRVWTLRMMGKWEKLTVTCLGILHPLSIKMNLKIKVPTKFLILNFISILSYIKKEESPEKVIARQG